MSDREHSGGGALFAWIAVCAAVIYLGIWLFCKLTGQKAEMPS